jgi:hypothetical protein
MQLPSAAARSAATSGDGERREGGMTVRLTGFRPHHQQVISPNADKLVLLVYGDTAG